MENNTGKIKGFLTSKRKKWIKEQLHNSWDLIKFAVLALIIVMPIRTFIAQPFIVSGDSMVPTFHNKEYLIVDEISYSLGNIKRGDVVIFKYPHDPSRYFIKRMIALPNETIVIKDKTVKIFNKEYPDGFVLDEPYINEDFKTDGAYQTGPEDYFVMGDNRNRSSDSRYWGNLPKKFIIGRAYLRLLPFDEISYLPGYHPQPK